MIIEIIAQSPNI